MTKHIYIYSPSSAIRDKAAFRRGVKRLKALGHDVEVDDAALSVHQRFAGDDATRLAAISRAAASGADVALIARGGYGLTRILDALPYKALAKAIAKGTEFVGCSDFTALQNALLAKTGATTWSGPAVGEDFGAEAPDDIMEACFDDLVTGQGEGTGWRMPARDAELKFKPVQDAVLWGGNLCVLTSLLGTPYFPAVDKGVLFIEDTNEHPYRIERMLDQLKLAGVLARQRAIVFGQFTGMRSVKGYDRGFGLNTVIDRLRATLKVPVLAGLPFGHVPTKVLLPVGAKVAVAAEGRDVFLVWGHRHAAGHDAHDHHAHDGHHPHAH